VEEGDEEEGETHTREVKEDRRRPKCAGTNYEGRISMGDLRRHSCEWRHEKQAGI